MPHIKKRKVLTITLTLPLCLFLLSPADARSLHATRDDAPASWIGEWTGWILLFSLGIPGIPAPGGPTDRGAWRSHPAGKMTAWTGSCVDPNGHPIPFPCNPT